MTLLMRDRENVEKGIKQGIEQGQNMLAELIERLFADNRIEDARLAATDESARRRFYKEYGLKE